MLRILTTDRVRERRVGRDRKKGTVADFPLWGKILSFLPHYPLHSCEQSTEHVL